MVEVLKILLLCIAFVILVGLLALLAAKINGVKLGKDPAEMSDNSRALYIALRPLWKIAEFISAPFRN